MEEVTQCQHLEGRRQWLSDCCGAGPVSDTLSSIVGICKKCRDWTGFELVCEDCGETVGEELES